MAQATSAAAYALAGAVLSCVSAAFSAALAIYKAVRAFQKGLVKEGAVLVAAATTFISMGVLGILVAAGVASGPAAPIVVLVLAVVGAILLMVASFMPGQPKLERPGDCDDIKLIQKAQELGVIYPKIRFGLHDQLECSIKKVEELFLLKNGPNANKTFDWVPTSEGEKCKTNDRNGLMNNPERRNTDRARYGGVVFEDSRAVMSLCLGVPQRKEQLAAIFSYGCTYRNGPAGGGQEHASHHTTAYWVQNPDIDYDSREQPEMPSAEDAVQSWVVQKNWDHGMTDWFERRVDGKVTRGYPDTRVGTHGCHTRTNTCFSFCGGDWFAGAYCWTGKMINGKDNEGFGTKEQIKCKKHADCEFYRPCQSACTPALFFYGKVWRRTHPDPTPEITSYGNEDLGQELSRLHEILKTP